MWKLPKPDLNATKGDIKPLVEHCTSLAETDIPLFEQLYDDYDAGHGRVSQEQLMPLEAKKDVVKAQYSKLSGNSNTLSYVKQELMSNVAKCPYCSINEPETLDHYMDKDTFGQLAVCRLNLVPMCFRCNNLKRTHPYDRFTHSYYQEFPSEPFLDVECKVIDNSIVFRVGFKDNVLDDELKEKLDYQFNTIQLEDRLQKAINEYISYTFETCFCSTDEELKIYLKKLEQVDEKRFSLNDWRTATIRGLLNCKDISMDVVKKYQNMPQ